MDKKIVTFTILWDDTDEYEGWYIDGELPNGEAFDIGPDLDEPGCDTIDEALAFIEKWATDRGFSYAPPIIVVRIAKEEQ